MTHIGMNTNVRDLLAFYKAEQRIFGRCPHCDDVFRLSEVKLTYGKEPPRDVLTHLKRAKESLEQRVRELNEQIAQMEHDHSAKIETLEEEHERELDHVEDKWRERVDIEVERHMLKKIKEIRQRAIAGSRATTLGKTIERIAPMFSGFGHHPGDVRPLFEPLDFVIFDGLYAGEVTDVVFLEFKTGNAEMSETQKMIRRAVTQKRVHFEERRMSADMLNRLVLGKKIPPDVASIEMKKPR
jgi:predicted Holliday junction resolvase-like endonuclease